MPRFFACILFLLFLAALFCAFPLNAQESAETSGRAQAADKVEDIRRELVQVQQSVCLLLESAARSNGLPIEFFVRLIWRESRFRPGAVGPTTRSGRHALGIAQFMPGTAAERNLLDPFNPIEALPKAAEFLKDLRDQFGNLGLAAAAYNAGPARVRAWMAGTGSMPAQTRAYVQAVTGNTIEEWASARDFKPKAEDAKSCETVMAALKQPPATFLAALEQRVVTGTMQPWGAILVAHKSRPEILDRYAALQRRFGEVLTGRDPIVLDRGSRAFARYQIRVGADSRTGANDICKKIHKAGGDCVVLRNPNS
ncbi:MAG TPA: transglycosylase SLT domain-containing protein [Pseudolabrys sp.]|nr:transglycosylase SLT domain-containing protein [Pseudolabrys sp.]